MEVSIKKLGDFPNFYKNNSSRKTTLQQERATTNKSAPNHAAAMPASNAIRPETGLCVAPMMAGNVMTASVT